MREEGIRTKGLIVGIIFIGEIWEIRAAILGIEILAEIMNETGRRET